MYPKCPMCQEDITRDIMATLCGHLYCMDCAAIEFKREDAMCAVCYKSWKYDELLRLFPQYGIPYDADPGQSEDAEETTRAKLDSLARQALDNYLEILERDANTDAAWRMPSSIYDLTVALSESEIRPPAQALYQSVVSLLAELTSTNTPNITHVQKLESELLELRTNGDDMTSQLETISVERDEYRKRSEAASDVVSMLTSQAKHITQERDVALERARVAEDRVRELALRLERTKRSTKYERSENVAEETEREDGWVSVNEMDVLKDELSNEPIMNTRTTRSTEKPHA
ncbi:hypothetical protein CERSUDRAFT_113087 [Gelatoporia subvermispora B]|uniref:RING-type domain-containing protein n=1 Tax=Ceriporiopsis subvermispora (strain B) TaxID=914234 RepID=M2RHJ1_CERS8|nr:hypothetical protein CERSUDRAFT_113087 [Gelatoporia subvermispora B]